MITLSPLLTPWSLRAPANIETFDLNSSYENLLLLPVIGLSYISAALLPLP